MTAFNPADAQLTRSRLEAAGFHPFVANEDAALSMDGYGSPSAASSSKCPKPRPPTPGNFSTRPDRSPPPRLGGNGHCCQETDPPVHRFWPRGQSPGGNGLAFRACGKFTRPIRLLFPAHLRSQRPLARSIFPYLRSIRRSPRSRRAHLRTVRAYARRIFPYLRSIRRSPRSRCAHLRIVRAYARSIFPYLRSIRAHLRKIRAYGRSARPYQRNLRRCPRSVRMCPFLAKAGRNTHKPQNQRRCHNDGWQCHRFRR